VLSGKDLPAGFRSDIAEGTHSGHEQSGMGRGAFEGSWVTAAATLAAGFLGDLDPAMKGQILARIRPGSQGAQHPPTLTSTRWLARGDLTRTRHGRHYRPRGRSARNIRNGHHHPLSGPSRTWRLEELRMIGVHLRHAPRKVGAAGKSE
jgi:hypothetical protein